MRQKLLLIEDVEDLGKSGEVVSVKAGYARNFLVPKKKAVVATKHTLRIQKKLQKERAKRAEEEKKESLKLAEELEGVALLCEVKVDPEGKMYGSVSKGDIERLLKEKGVEVDKKRIDLKHPIKKVGVFDIKLKLKEGVTGVCKLKIVPEGGEEKREEPKEPEVSKDENREQ